MKSELPNWITELDTESLEFIRIFVIESGSLKQVAKNYNVSYPTVRIKLNKLIEKIELYSEKEINLEFINIIKNLAIEEKINLEVAKMLINQYKKERGESIG